MTGLRNVPSPLSEAGNAGEVIGRARQQGDAKEAKCFQAFKILGLKFR